MLPGPRASRLHRPPHLSLVYCILLISPIVNLLHLCLPHPLSSPQAIVELEQQAAQQQIDYTARDTIRREVADVLDYRSSKAELAVAARSLQELEARVAQVRREECWWEIKGGGQGEDD